jgi:hypothetical protein
MRKEKSAYRVKSERQNEKLNVDERVLLKRNLGVYCVYWLRKEPTGGLF